MAAPAGLPIQTQFYRDGIIRLPFGNMIVPPNTTFAQLQALVSAAHGSNFGGAKPDQLAYFGVFAGINQNFQFDLYIDNDADVQRWLARNPNTLLVYSYRPIRKCACPYLGYRGWTMDADRQSAAERANILHACITCRIAQSSRCLNV